MGRMVEGVSGPSRGVAKVAGMYRESRKECRQGKEGESSGRRVGSPWQAKTR